jgi:Protein of unknown function (DUF3489)
MCRRDHQEEFKMTKSRPARKVKSATTTEKLRKAAEPNEAISPKQRANSKQADVIGMLRQPQGSTMSAIMKATGWQSHSVRGFFAGVVRKKLSLTLKSEKPNDGERIYRIVGGKLRHPRSKADISKARAA